MQLRSQFREDSGHLDSQPGMHCSTETGQGAVASNPIDVALLSKQVAYPKQSGPFTPGLLARYKLDCRQVADIIACRDFYYLRELER